MFSFPSSSLSILFLPHPDLFLSGGVPVAGYPAITIIIPFKVALQDLFIPSPTIYFLFQPCFLNQVDNLVYFSFFYFNNS